MREAISSDARDIRRQLERLARTRHVPLDRLIQDFAAERFLNRLASSPLAESLVVKGAALLRLWAGPEARPTRDIDFCGRIEGSLGAVAKAIRQCLDTEVPDDGLVFAGELEAEPIVVDGQYPGTRVVLRANLAGARVRLQLDIGIGDSVVPEPGWVDYPTLLDLPSPRVLAYAPATTVAEKFHVMVAWGLVNSRMKDYHDLWFLATKVHFDGPELAAALVSTFARRVTTLPSALPAALTEAFWQDAATDKRWSAFVSRLGTGTSPALPEAVEVIASFLGPVQSAAASGSPFNLVWSPGGPWMATGSSL